ncbi:hypothetical protein [Thiorhodococcus fuscus]|uniref:hypothetical protein n=1 Tax=Thiorhodococcus fuscus TaxID=527200 RepID=UPI0036D8D621
MIDRLWHTSVDPVWAIDLADASSERECHQIRAHSAILAQFAEKNRAADENLGPERRNPMKRRHQLRGT